MKKLIAIVILITTLCLIGCNSPSRDTLDDSRFTKVSVSETIYITYRAIEMELGYTLIVDEPVRSEIVADGVKTVSYDFTLDTKYTVGVRYYVMTFEEYEQLQAYQNEFNKQVIYPTVKYQDRPDNERYKYDGNIYYVLEDTASTSFRPKLDENGNVIPNYWKYEKGSESTLIPDYNSLRIEGADGIEENGVTYFYAYGRKVDVGVEVRVDYLEYCNFRDYISGTATKS